MESTSKSKHFRTVTLVDLKHENITHFVMKNKDTEKILVVDSSLNVVYLEQKFCLRIHSSNTNFGFFWVKKIKFQNSRLGQNTHL